MPYKCSLLYGLIRAMREPYNGYWIMDSIKFKNILGMLTMFFQTFCLGLEPRSTPYLASSLTILNRWMVGS